MADITITPQDIVRTGLTPSYTGSLSIANTYHIANNGNTFLHFKNTGGSPATATIPTTKTVLGYAVSDQTVQVPATSGDKMIGPFPPAVFGTDLTFTLDVATGVSVAALRL